MITLCELTLDSTFDEVEYAIEKIEKVLNEHFLIEREKLFVLTFAARELINNGIEHGNKMDPSKKVKLRMVKSIDSIEIRVKDEGKGFNLKQIIDGISWNDEIRERQRGLLTLIELDFTLKTEGEEVVATIKNEKVIKE